MIHVEVKGVAIADYSPEGENWTYITIKFLYYM